MQSAKKKNQGVTPEKEFVSLNNNTGVLKMSAQPLAQFSLTFEQIL